MTEVKFFDRVGPGGRDCPCCGPAPKKRKQHDRMVKRRIKQHIKREIDKELKECYSG